MHTLIHAPFSIKYHCDNTSITNIKYDGIFMYISHIIIHIALCLRSVPWQISSITITLFTFSCIYIIECINKQNDKNKVIAINTNYAVVFILHYIPILFKIKPLLVLHHLLSFIVIHILFSYSLVSKYINYIINISDINIDNAIMHIGLIINTIFCYYLVSI